MLLISSLGTMVSRPEFNIYIYACIVYIYLYMCVYIYIELLTRMSHRDKGAPQKTQICYQACYRYS